MKKNNGFSLLETLLYLGIFAIVGGSLFGILTNVVRISTREISGDEVASQLQFAMETVTRLVRESSAIENATTTATTTLKLRMPISTQDPTCITLVNGVLKMAQGPDQYQQQNCTATTTDLTTSKVIVDNALFKRIATPGGHDQVAIDMQFSNTATGVNKISRALRTGVARVSAATFDADLLPNTDAQYEVGFSTKRWKNINVSGLLNLGAASGAPSGAQNGSLYYDTSSNTFKGYANGVWGDLGAASSTGATTTMGSGTTNQITKWLTSSSIGNSILFDNGTNIGIGTAAPSQKLDVNGYVKGTGLCIGASCKTVWPSGCTISAESAWSACDAPAPNCTLTRTYGIIKKTRTIDCGTGATSFISATQGCVVDVDPVACQFALNTGDRYENGITIALNKALAYFGLF